jgi:hypothetical protein
LGHATGTWFNQLIPSILLYFILRSTSCSSIFLNFQPYIELCFHCLQSLFCFCSVVRFAVRSYLQYGGNGGASTQVRNRKIWQWFC